MMTWISLQNPINHLDLAMSQSREIGLCFLWFQLSSTSALFLKIHDDVIKWKQYLYYWSFVMCVRGIHRSGSPVKSLTNWWSENSPHKHDKGPVMRPVNKRLSKQSWGWIFETPLHPLWRHCNVSGFSVTNGGPKMTGTIYFCNWGTPVNKRIPHIFVGAPIWLSQLGPHINTWDSHAQYTFS